MAWYDEDEDNEGFEPEPEPLEADFTVWRTKDGRRIPLTDMTPDHLRRTIQVLRRKSPHGTTVNFRDPLRRVAWVQAMVAELQRRGEALPASRALPST